MDERIIPTATVKLRETLGSQDLSSNSRPNLKRPFIIAAGIILILLILIGGYLFFKQQSANSKIASIKNFEECKKAGYPILTSMPAQCSIPSGKIFYGPPQAETNIQPTVKADETANWKTYKEKDFLIKIPKNWYKSDEKISNSIRYQSFDPTIAPQRGFDPSQDKGLLVVDITTTNSMQSLENFVSKYKADNEAIIPNQFIEEQTISVANQQAIKSKSIYGYDVFVKSPDKNIIFDIGFGLDFNNYADLRDQILSTFKFTDQSGGEKACTQEAQTCPDGSAVGRAGPKCEFAACPR